MLLFINLPYIILLSFTLKIFFPCSITLSVSLLHYFHPETSFVLDLQFYNGNTEGALAFDKSRLSENCWFFCQFYYTYENSKYFVH